MSGLPASVRVGPWTYKIVTDPAEIEQAAEGNVPDGSSWEAFSDHQRHVIGVDVTHAPGAVRLSVLHELLHCCLRISGCWPNPYAAVLARARHRDAGVDMEEFVVAGTAGVLLGVLRDNPELMAWLTA